MYAIVVHVKIDADRRDEAEQLLHEEVVPSVQQAPGLVGAYWLRSEDGTDGYSVILFEDKDSAESRRPQSASTAGRRPVQLAAVEIHEVLATA